MIHQEAATPGFRPLPVRLSLLGTQWEAVDTGPLVDQADLCRLWLRPFSLGKSLPTSQFLRFLSSAKALLLAVFFSVVCSSCVPGAQEGAR